jgi:hypothetical protein
LLFVLAFAVVTGLALSACGPGDGGDGNVDPPQSETPPSAPPSETPTPGGGSGGNGAPSTPGAPSPQPTDDCLPKSTFTWDDLIRDLAELALNNTIIYPYQDANPNYYMRFLIQEAINNGLYTDELAYVLATAHLEMRWSALVEDGTYEELERKYGRRTEHGKILGNTQEGDGFNYRGRGFVHITGRWNYRNWGFEDNPKALEEPGLAAHVAVAGMKIGSFRSENLPDGTYRPYKLSDYYTVAGYDYFNARDIINGDKYSPLAGSPYTIGKATALVAKSFADVMSEYCEEFCNIPGLLCR